MQRKSAKEELEKATDVQDQTAQAIAQRKLEELDSQMTDLSPKAKRAREAASWEKVMTDSEGGPEVKPENALVAKGVVELYNTFSSSGKARYNEITTGGLWEKKLHEWKEEGSGNIELLKAKFAKAIATGEGLKGRVQKAELHPIVEKTLDVPVKPETVPIKQTAYENALKVTEGYGTCRRSRYVLGFLSARKERVPKEVQNGLG